MSTVLLIDQAYPRAIRVALVVQCLMTLLLLRILDGGQMAKIGGCTMLAFWIGAAVIILRRPMLPRGIDLVYIRWGYLPLLLAAPFIAGFIRKSI